MNDTRRRMLTEYLDECWHEGGSDYYRTCVTCHRIHSNYELENERRTFTTSQDMVDLVKKMVERGDWRKFLRFTWESWPGFEGEFTAWLITDPARTCELIAEWKEAEHGRDR